MVKMVGGRESREGTRNRMGQPKNGSSVRVKGTFREVGEEKTEWWGLSSKSERKQGFTHLPSEVHSITGKLPLSSVNHQMRELKETSGVGSCKSFTVQMSRPAK